MKMKRRIKKWTAMVMAVIMLAGVMPVSTQAEEAAVESSQEAVQEEEDKTEAETEVTTEEEKKIEEVTETADEPTEETLVEEETTEQSTEDTTTETDNTVSVPDTEPAPVPEDSEVPEEEQEEEEGLQPEELKRTQIVQLEASDSRTIYSDGSWGGGTIWYVKSGNSKHYIFCLEKGVTMYSGKYSGDITNGYSGKSAFKKAVALNYFYRSNGGSWSGKKNYGVAQELIWNEGSGTAGKLASYVNHAWNVTSLNSGRKSGSGSFSSLLTPINQSETTSASARKTMIQKIKKAPVQLSASDVDGVCTNQIKLPGSSWKYFAKGGYSGNSSDISVTGIFDEDGNVVAGSASVDTSGNLNVKVAPETNKGDSKEHPLTVIMSVKFDYLGADSIRYVKTGDGKQNLTYDASFCTAGCFAIQVYNDIPDIADAKVNINKVDEYGNFVPGCTFRLTGISGEAKDSNVDSGNVVIVDPADCFTIKYPGKYQIVETAVPDDGEYTLNTTPFTFEAERTADNKIVLNATLVSPDGKTEFVVEEPSFTYTCINQFNEGAAELVKTGNVLTRYDKASGRFIYQQRKLEDVQFSFYAAEDIYANEQLIFSAGEEITNNRYWGGKYNILNPKYHQVRISGKEVRERDEFGFPLTSIRTDQNGRLGISGLPAGDYFCVETGFLPGFSKIQKKYDFTVEAAKTVQINGTAGILNEQAPAASHVYKVDADTDRPLGGGEFTIYADVGNKNYDGKALFQKSDTVSAVVKRNLFTGKETTEEGVWVPIQKVTTRADGMAEFEDLPAGRYLVAETKAPEGYALAEESYIFTHDSKAEQSSNGYNFEHTFKDSRAREYKILKHAEKAVPAESQKINSDAYIYEEEPIAGVQFGIYAAEDVYNTLGEKVAQADTQIGTCTTNAEGVAAYSGHLFAGKYYFKELQTADAERYILDDTRYSFSISPYMTDGRLNDDVIVNKLYKGSIKVIKTDGRSKAPLPNISFQLMDEKENVLGNYKTDKKGGIHIKNLPVGKYLLKETKAPKGYELDDSVQEIVISKDNLDQVAEFKNYRNKTSITVKTDTTIKGGGSVRTGDMSIGFIFILFLLSSAGAAYIGKKKGFQLKKLSVKGKKSGGK